MPIKVTIVKGVGQLKRNPAATSANDVDSKHPWLLGLLKCQDEHGEHSVTLQGAAWIKEQPAKDGADGKPRKFYSLDFGGLEASLFKVTSEDKKKNPAGPDYTGNFAYGEHAGKMRLAAWIKYGDEGKSYLSLALEEKGRMAVDPNYRMREDEDPTFVGRPTGSPADNQQSTATSSIPGFD